MNSSNDINHNSRLVIKVQTNLKPTVTSLLRPTVSCAVDAKIFAVNLKHFQRI
jgi:hypothetical protein